MRAHTLVSGVGWLSARKLLRAGDFSGVALGRALPHFSLSLALTNFILNSYHFLESSKSLLFFSGRIKFLVYFIHFEGF